MRAIAATPGHWEAVFEGVSGSWEATREQVRAVRDLGDLPLFVLTAPDNPGFGEMKGPWLKMQAELSAPSRGEHRVLEGSSHVGTMTAAREVVGAVRRKP